MDDLIKYITGNIKSVDKKVILNKIREDKETKIIFRKAKIAWALMSSTRKAPEDKINKSFNNLQNRISSSNPVIKLYPLFKYAAIVILFIAVSSAMFFVGKKSGKLSDSAIKYTSVVAANGQISKVILPDSSIVWLNSGSTLTYDSKYAQNNRALDLVGQAFFDVRKNKKVPLIVSTCDLQVKVHGTKFDVCAYPDEDKISVMLESGSIELLHAKNKAFSYMLNPGEMAEYDTDGKSIAVNESGLKNYTGWKDGVLRFKDTPMAEVIKKLERKFDVDITVENPAVYNSVFNANFRNENISTIMEYIHFSCPVSYRIQKGDGLTKSKIVLY